MTQLLSRSPLIGRTRYLLFHRHYNRFAEWGLVVLCLALTLLSTFLLRDATKPSQIIVAFLPILLIAVVAIIALIYARLHWLVVVIPVLSTVFHEGIDTGTETKLTFTFLLLNLWALLWFVKMVVANRKISVRPSAANWPAVFFIVMALISFVWSTVFVDYQVRYLYEAKFLPRLMTIIVMIISPLTTLLYANHLRSERAFRWIVWWFLAVASIFWIRFFIAWPRKSIIDTGGQFSAFVCALALGQLLFNHRLPWYIKLLLLWIIGIWMYIQIQLGITWLSGWLPVVVAIVLVTLFYSRKLALVFVLVGIVYLWLTSDIFSANLERENQESGVTRTAAWEQALDVTVDHLFLGTGPAGYHYYLTAYGIYDTGIAQLSHNNYVDILSQTGILGLIAYATFWIGVGIMAWKLLWTPMPTDFLRGLKAAVLAAYPVTLLSMMLGDWVIPFPYTQTLAGIDHTIWHWMMAGILMALYYFASDQAKNPVLLAKSEATGVS